MPMTQPANPMPHTDAPFSLELDLQFGDFPEVARARAVLAAAAPARIDVHQGNAPTGVLAGAAG